MTTDPLNGPFPTGQMLTDFSDDPEFAILPAGHPEQEEEAGQ